MASSLQAGGSSAHSCRFRAFENGGERPMGEGFSRAQVVRPSGWSGSGGSGSGMLGGYGGKRELSRMYG